MTRAVEFPFSLCRFGIARADITPPSGIYHRMWGAAAHDRATGVHRPLMATAFHMSPEDGPGVTVVSVDHCVFWFGANARLLAGVATEGVDPPLIACTHTHAAGLVDLSRADRPGGELIAPYLDSLAARINQLAAEARATAKSCVISYGFGRCDLAVHRDYPDGERVVCGYNPDGPADDTVLAMRVTDETGRPVATLVNYACHPTTLAWQNPLISPDFPGAMRELVERDTGVPCAFLQGASGDLGPRDGFVGDPAVADRNGRRLGYAALAALEGLPPPLTRFEYAGAVESGAVLGTWKYKALSPDARAAAGRWRHQRWTVEVPYRADLPTIADTRRDRDKWAAEERDALAPGDAKRAADCRAYVERMDRQLMRLADLPAGAGFPLTVDLWQAGDAVWLAVGAEHYQYLQTELRRRFPRTPVVVTTLVNGWAPGYLPTAGVYGRGVYQERIAMVAAGGLELLTENIALRIAEWVP